MSSISTSRPTASTSSARSRRRIGEFIYNGSTIFGHAEQASRMISQPLLAPAFAAKIADNNPIKDGLNSI